MVITVTAVGRKSTVAQIQSSCSLSCGFHRAVYVYATSFLIFHSISHTKITTSSTLIELSSSLDFLLQFCVHYRNLELHHLEKKEGHESYRRKRGFLTLCLLLLIVDAIVFYAAIYS